MTILNIYKTVSLCSLFCMGFSPLPAYCQGSPLPGPSTVNSSLPPLPGQSETAFIPGNAGKAPVPGGHGAATPTGMSEKLLPLSVQTASSRLEELRNLMHTMRPKEFQDALALYLDWLAEMADGHWRLSQSMGKQESLKKQAESEKQQAFKLGSLKRQAMLLKAEFLIKQGRQAEALAPLVDIVVNEPKTAIGQSAYQLLKDIGFSEETASLETSSLSP